MVTLDKVLNGILAGCIVTIGSIGAYYKIKKDYEKEESKSTSRYASLGSFAGTGSWSHMGHLKGDTFGKEDKKDNKAPI
jgi:hypothetical protein